MPEDRGRNTIDDLDRALIAELIVDGRASFSTLAPLVGLSQAAVRTRVQRLLQDHVVTVTARIDPATAGLAVFALALLLVDDSAREVAARLDAVDEAVFVACITGRWGLVVELRCSDNRHLLTTLDCLRADPAVSEVESLTVMEYFKQDWAGLAQEALGRTIATHSPTPVPATYELDAVDHQLIASLIVDGRATYADLAPVTGLSQAAVRARVQRLLDEEIVVIQAYANASSLGIRSFALGLLAVNGDTLGVVEKLAAMPEVTLIAATSGRYDMAIEVWCRDDAHLLDTLDAIRRFKAVSVVASHTVLDITKEEYRISEP